MWSVEPGTTGVVNVWKNSGASVVTPRSVASHDSMDVGLSGT